MMYPLGTMREFNTRNFKIVCDAVEEDDLDLSFDETGEVKHDLEIGRLISFVARVRVFYHGTEVGTDYLGGCIYRSLDDFMDHRECGRQNTEYESKGEHTRCGSYFHQMINDACAEARKHLAEYKNLRVRSVA